MFYHTEKEEKSIAARKAQKKKENIGVITLILLENQRKPKKIFKFKKILVLIAKTEEGLEV